MLHSELFTVLFTTGAILLACWYFFLYRKRNGNQYKLPPCPVRPWPLVGNIFSMGDDIRAQFKAWHKQCGGLFSIYFGTKLVVVVNGFKTHREVFVYKAAFSSDRPRMFLNEAIGMGETGIVFSSGVIWKELRYTTHQILKEFGMGTNFLAERIQEEVICYVKKLVEMKGKPVDPQHFTYVSVSNIICSIMFGRRFSYDDPRFKKTVDSLNRVSECARGAGAINFLPFLKYLPGDMFKAKKIQVNWLSVKKVLAEIVFEIERQGKITAKKRNSGNYIFSYRDKQHKNKQIGNATCLDDDNLLKNIIDLFAAGTETVASSIVWCLLFILHTPSVQTKIHEELDREVGQERQPTMEDQARLPYLNAVIKETQRLSNVVPFSVMHKTSEEIKIGDFIIPKGTTLIPNLDSVLHDPEVWGSDAEIFNPDRFLDKDGNVIHREEFIPFSLGPRICVGEAMAKMELFLFLSSMFQRFQFVAKDSKNLPTLKPNIGFTSVPTAFEILCVDRFKKTEALV